MVRRRSILVMLALITATLAGVAPGARAVTTLFVDINDGTCSDISGPVYCTIQAAVNDAGKCSTV